MDEVEPYFAPTLCNMFQDHNLVAKFHRIAQESCENLRHGMRGILTEMTNGSVTGFIAIPSVIFFPGSSNATATQLTEKHQDKLLNHFNTCEYFIDWTPWWNYISWFPNFLLVWIHLKVMTFCNGDSIADLSITLWEETCNSMNDNAMNPMFM